MITKPQRYGGAFFATIVVFASIYAIWPSTITGVKDVLDALYFSIVTITTLGFGDVLPAGPVGKALVCAEAILGVVFVGLFLNAISESQARQISQNEKNRTKEQRKDNARAKLRQYYKFLYSIMARYLIEAFSVTTPIENRKFPKDVMHHQFSFMFNDICDLYRSSLLMYDPPYKPVIAIFFELQDKLYDEFRRMISDIDVSYWPEMETNIQSFLQVCNTFAYKGSILSCAHSTVNNKDAEFLSKLIKEHKGELEMKKSNSINQFVALYPMLQANITLVQQIAEQMRQNCEIENS